MCPGLLNDGRVFAPQVAVLGDRADIVIADVAAHDSIVGMASAALARAPARFALAGFSMGGYVAFEIMRRARQKVDRLALIDTQANPDSPEASSRRRGLIEQTRIGRFHGVQRSLLPQLVHGRNVDKAAIAQPIFDMAREIGAEGFVREQTAIIGRPDSRPLLADIDVPTVVIAGRQDQVAPLPRSQEMAADIATSRLVVLEECGHMSPLEKPAEVAAALRRWLTQ
jgi:pimeloyl-ACP methyl ester carboxylesterase